MLIVVDHNHFSVSTFTQTRQDIHTYKQIIQLISDNADTVVKINLYLNLPHTELA